MIKVTEVSKIYRRFERTGGLLGAVKDLFYREYSDFTAVDNISFNIPQGEIVGFIGPNGAGKTTTIKMLTGIMSQTSGKIEVCGLSPFEERKKLAQHIGVLFGKRSNLVWDLPVEDGFKMLIDLYQAGSRGRERLNELKGIVNIEHLLRSPIRKLSLGQRTLCEVVASVLHNPRVLFLDEPTIGLDLFAKEQVRNLIKYVNNNWGVTVFLTTHDLSDIRKLAEHVILISKGSIFYDGTLEGLLQRANELSRTIIFSSESELKDDVKSIEKIRGIENIEKDKSNKLTITFDPIYLSAVDIIKNVMDKVDITDISIPDVNIEDIVRYMYKGKGDIA